MTIKDSAEFNSYTSYDARAIFGDLERDFQKIFPSVSQEVIEDWALEQKEILADYEDQKGQEED